MSRSLLNLTIHHRYRDLDDGHDLSIEQHRAYHGLQESDRRLGQELTLIGELEHAQTTLESLSALGKTDPLSIESATGFSLDSDATDVEDWQKTLQKNVESSLEARKRKFFKDAVDYILEFFDVNKKLAKRINKANEKLSALEGQTYRNKKETIELSNVDLLEFDDELDFDRLAKRLSAHSAVMDQMFKDYQAHMSVMLDELERYYNGEHDQKTLKKAISQHTKDYLERLKSVDAQDFMGGWTIETPKPQSMLANDKGEFVNPDTDMPHPPLPMILKENKDSVSARKSVSVPDDVSSIGSVLEVLEQGNRQITESKELVESIFERVKEFRAKDRGIEHWAHTGIEQMRKSLNARMQLFQASMNAVERVLKNIQVKES